MSPRIRKEGDKVGHHNPATRQTSNLKSDQRDVIEQTKDNDPLTTLRAAFDRPLAWLREPDAGEKLRRAFAAGTDEIARAANEAARLHFVSYHLCGASIVDR